MWILLVLLFAAPLFAEPPDLEEVACTWCHYEEAEDFAESVHYLQGHLLCTDCHGGLPFAEDPDLAKAPEAGFIGKPGRADVAEVCTQCHSGPAGFFAQGPHHEWQNEANPTCITCHSNHRVLDASLALMDETCSQCHDEWSAARDRGQKIRVELKVGAEHLQRVAMVVDSLSGFQRSLQKAQPFIQDAAAVLQSADAATHALDVQMIEGMVAEVRGERGVAGAEGVVGAYYEKLRMRPRFVFAVWVFVLVNVALFWWKRRDLP